MTPEKLKELEKLEAAATPGPWESPQHFWVCDEADTVSIDVKPMLTDAYDRALHTTELLVALRNNARDLFAALREAWRERDEARARLRLIEERHQDWGFIHDSLKADVLSLMKERDEACCGRRRKASARCATQPKTL